MAVTMDATVPPVSAAPIAPWFRWHLVLLVVFGLVAEAHAAIYQIDFTGTVLAQTGSWDSSIQSGAPLHLSATFFTPPPEAYDFGGYMTYVYRAAPARMTLEAGDYLFDGGRVDFTVWNNDPYFRYSDGTQPVDGFQIFTDTGTSPGFSQVMFSASLQTTATNTLATKDLPTQALPLAVFDRLYGIDLNVNLSGSGAFAHLDGLITGYTLVEVPEPSPLLLLLAGSAVVLMAQAIRRARHAGNLTGR
jgi:hypothetical protein